MHWLPINSICGVVEQVIELDAASGNDTDRTALSSALPVSTPPPIPHTPRVTADVFLGRVGRSVSDTAAGTVVGGAGEGSRSVSLTTTTNTHHTRNDSAPTREADGRTILRGYSSTDSRSEQHTSSPGARRSYTPIRLATHQTDAPPPPLPPSPASSSLSSVVSVAQPEMDDREVVGLEEATRRLRDFTYVRKSSRSEGISGGEAAVLSAGRSRMTYTPADVSTMSWGHGGRGGSGGGLNSTSGGVGGGSMSRREQDVNGSGSSGTYRKSLLGASSRSPGTHPLSPSSHPSSTDSPHPPYSTHSNSTHHISSNSSSSSSQNRLVLSRSRSSGRQRPSAPSLNSSSMNKKGHMSPGGSLYTSSTHRPINTYHASGGPDEVNSGSYGGGGSGYSSGMQQSHTSSGGNVRQYSSSSGSKVRSMSAGRQRPSPAL